MDERNGNSTIKIFNAKATMFISVLANAVKELSNDGKILFVNENAAALTFHLLST